MKVLVTDGNNRAALAVCCAGWLVATGPVLAEEARPEPKPLKLTTTAAGKRSDRQPPVR